MPVPNTFANATTSIPLSQLDTNFATAITLGNTAIQLGNTVSTLNNMTLANVTISSGTVSVANATVTGNVTMSGGNLSFTSTGQRITGDFSNATVASRLMFKSGSTNGTTSVGALPDGTGNYGGFSAYNASDAGNASVATIAAASTEAQIVSTRTGTGTYLPMTFYTNAAERMRLDTSGNLGIGTTAPAVPLGVVANSGSNAIRLIGRSSDNISTLDFVSNNSASSYAYLQASSSYFAFGTSATERMRIDSSGNVGIGTSSPSSYGKLAVIGTSGAQQAFIGVGNDGWTFNTFSSGSAYLTYASATVTTTAIGNQQAIPLAFLTTNTERMRIDSSGNVGIGTSSPGLYAKLTVLGGSIYTDAALYSNDGTTTARVISSGGISYWGTTTNHPMVIQTNNTERARIDSSGNFMVGTTSSTVASKNAKVTAYQTSPSPAITSYVNATTASNQIIFVNPNGEVGSINTDGTTTSYGTSSDYRLKYDVQPMLSGLSTIAALKPSTYKWNADNSYGEGFIAHELQAVIPQAVSGEKDAVNDDGSIKAQGVDYSKIVVHLVAAIQELKAEFDAYKAAHP